MSWTSLFKWEEMENLQFGADSPTADPKFDLQVVFALVFLGHLGLFTPQVFSPLTLFRTIIQCWFGAHCNSHKKIKQT